MSTRITEPLDESYDEQLYEQQEPAQGGRHLKKSGTASHVRRRTEPTAEEWEAAVEEAPRRERRVREEDVPRRERPAREESAARRERRAVGEAAPVRQRRPAEEAQRRPNRQPASPPPRRRKKKKRRTGWKVLIILLALLAALAVAGYLIFMHFYGMLNTPGSKTAANAAPTPAAQTENVQAATPEPTPEPSPTPEPLSEEEKAALAEMELMASLQKDAEDIIYDENVYNVLLLGADGLENAMERSDSMILASMNTATGDIWLTSLMRDTQVTIPNWGLAHLNWATSIGGVDMLIDTIESEKNFAIHVDNWAMVNFLDFVKVANLLGPVTVTVKASETANMNQNIRQVCQMIDESEGRGLNDPNNIPRYYFPEGEDGTYTITDGAQILGFCRERKVGGDTGRSEKQREVLRQMWQNVQKMTLTEQYELVKTILPIVTTDISPARSFSLLLQLPAAANYEIHTQQCPAIGSFWKGRDQDGLSIYGADFGVNRNFLRATIYGQRFSAAELTSSWTGERTLVYWNDEWN